MPTYDPEALERGIQQCLSHIVSLKEAIQKEREIIKDYQNKIRDIKAQQERVAARDRFAREVENLGAEN